MKMYSRANPKLREDLQRLPRKLKWVALRVLPKLASIEAGKSSVATEAEVDEMLEALEKATLALAWENPGETVEVREVDSTRARRWHVHVEKP